MIHFWIQIQVSKSYNMHSHSSKPLQWNAICGHYASFSLHIVSEEVIVHFEFIIFKHLFIVWVLNIYVGRLLKFYDLISDYLCQQS